MKVIKYLIIAVAIFFHTQINAQADYKKIHDAAIVIDTHNDILTKVMEKNVAIDGNLEGETQSDLQRWNAGGVDVQFFSVWCDGDKINPYAFANRQMDSLDAVVKRNPDKIVTVANIKELLKAVEEHKLAALFGVEGGHMIENDLIKLEHLYKRGARYMTLTWNNSTDWATSAADETTKKDLQHKGLTDFGKNVVQKMNALGMMVDISHVGEQTFWDVIHTTTKPVIASHSSVYTLCPFRRNLKDDQIKAVAKNGGVISVNFYSGFLDSTYFKKKEMFLQKHNAEKDSLIKNGMIDFMTEEFLFSKYKAEVKSMRAPFSLLMQHIEYIIKLVGIDYVGLGSDFDGIESAPLQLDDVTTYPFITKALLEKGYSKKDITKILGGNVLRVLRANEVR